jgi:hypothetical protein
MPWSWFSLPARPRLQALRGPPERQQLVLQVLQVLLLVRSHLQRTRSSRPYGLGMRRSWSHRSSKSHRYKAR